MQSADDWQPGPNWVQCDPGDDEEQEATETREFVCCAWFTGDYAKWVAPLISDLDRLGYQHDFIEMPKPVGTRWEEVTRLKATMLGRFMDRHEGKWILLVDVDCRLLGPVDELIQGFRGYIGFHINTRFRGTGGTKIRVRSVQSKPILPIIVPIARASFGGLVKAPAYL